MEKETNILKTRQVFIIHFLVWGVLFAVPFILNPFMPNRPSKMMVIPYIHLFSLMFIYYFNAYILVPRLLHSKRILRYVFYVTLFVTVVFLGTQHLLQFVHNLFGNPVRITAPALIGPIARGLFQVLPSLMVVALGIAIKLFERLVLQERHHVNVQKEKLNTELAFLKNQINPHFFFNTLNTIYSLTITNAAAAQETLLKLSNLMRYLLYETEKQYTTLGKEVDFIKGYIELMQVRTSGNVSVSFSALVKHPNRQLPPLLFIAFVENAFKHGVSNVQDCLIEISLVEVNEALIFKSINPIFRKHSELDPRGIGLENVKRRLGLLYPSGQYQLNIEDKGEQFEINLSIPLKND